MSSNGLSKVDLGREDLDSLEVNSESNKGVAKGFSGVSGVRGFDSRRESTLGTEIGSGGTTGVKEIVHGGG
jgi:hypothetical protein